MASTSGRVYERNVAGGSARVQYGDVRHGDVTNNYYAIREEKDHQYSLSLAQRNQKLIKASADGQVIRLRIALEAGADVDFTDAAEETALHKAARAGHEECARLLFQHGADVNQLNKDGKTPLDLALQHRSEAILAFLLQQRGSLGMHPVSKVDSHDRSPLFVATIEARVSSCEALIQAGVDVNRGRGQRTPLMEAARIGNETILNLLICNGARLDERDVQGETALLYAVTSRHVGICELLLDAGANTNLRTPEAPLLTAYCTQQSQIYALLLQRGAHVDVQDRNGMTALHHTAVLQDLAGCEMLVAAYTNIELAATIDGELYTPRRLAKRHGSTQIVAFLESKGARKGHWYGPYSGVKRLRPKMSYPSISGRPPSEPPQVLLPSKTFSSGAINHIAKEQDVPSVPQSASMAIPRAMGSDTSPRAIARSASRLLRGDKSQVLGV